MKLFKNFKTKKQLREENEKLNDMLRMVRFVNARPTIITEKVSEKVKCSVMQSWRDSDVPEEIFRNEIAHNLMKQIKPYIDFQTREEPSGEKVYTGTLYVLRDR
ncbi:MAG: hypothetical protein HFG89_00460 [Dorea sp.]|jgi:hypothetical protein|nr:hypothetical protein [Dorea sp.]